MVSNDAVPNGPAPYGKHETRGRARLLCWTEFTDVPGHANVLEREGRVGGREALAQRAGAGEEHPLKRPVDDRDAARACLVVAERAARDDRHAERVEILRRDVPDFEDARRIAATRDVSATVSATPSPPQGRSTESGRRRIGLTAAGGLPSLLPRDGTATLPRLVRSWFAAR